MMLNVTRQIISSSNCLVATGLNLQFGVFTQIRCKSEIYVKRPKKVPIVKFEASAQSLKAKGYLRAQNPYTPPKNVPLIVQKLKNTAGLNTGFGEKKFTIEDKFSFLTVCANEFNHIVPNSVLHEIETIDDVIDFYETPINTFLPLDELATRELPPNLHIEHKYTRFHPDTDTMFGGKTAFPCSSTIVTGIKYRKKYPGHTAEKKQGIDEDP